MDNREAVNWLINISADIGKAEHSDLWHYEQALTEIKDMLESAQLSREGTTKDATSDTISRQTAIDALDCINGAEEVLRSLPPAQPEPSEITDEQAILHLQSTGWMQNHDREMYESGLRKQLADDSESYNSLIPCEDTISRQVAIDVLAEWEATHMWDEWCNDHKNEAEKYHITAPSAVVKTLPSAEPERKKGHWILYDKRFPWSKDYKCSECGNYINISDINAGRGSANFCPNCGAKMEEKQYE